MTTLSIGQAIGTGVSTPDRTGSSRGLLKALLIIGCVAAVAIGLRAGGTAAAVHHDADLAFLLRGMAAIKGAMLLLAIGLVLWRFGRPVSRPLAGAYLCSIWLAAGATALIWQLSFIPFAAAAFHIGTFLFLAAAWRDGGAIAFKRASPASRVGSRV